MNLSINKIVVFIPYALCKKLTILMATFFFFFMSSPKKVRPKEPKPNMSS